MYYTQNIWQLGTSHNIALLQKMENANVLPCQKVYPRENISHTYNFSYNVLVLIEYPNAYQQHIPIILYIHKYFVSTFLDKNKRKYVFIVKFLVLV